MTRQVLALSLSLAATAAQAEVHVYSIHVGVNQPPSGSGLDELSFADDDAVRFQTFMSRFSQKSVAATLPDNRTNQLFPEPASHAVPPTKESIERALNELSARIEKDSESGFKTVLYFTYSGHGVPDPSGSVSLALLDAVVGEDWLEKHVFSVKADLIHVIIDACRAEEVVSERGPRSAAPASITTQEETALARREPNHGNPTVGLFLGAASGVESHEWSAVEMGVFTFEVLSGLAGPADVNLDGVVTYTELAAFLASANQGVKQAKAAVASRYSPPAVNRNAPLLDRSWFRDKPAVLQGRAATDCAFKLEGQGGLALYRWRPEPGWPFWVVLPDSNRLWLKCGRKEAGIRFEQGEVVKLEDLAFIEQTGLASRGGAAEALRKGLFSISFGPSYYRGWVDGRGEVPVGMPGDSSDYPNQPITEEPLWPSVLSAAAGGASLTAAMVFGGLAVKARMDYDSTDLEKPAREAWDRMKLNTTLAASTALAGAGLFVVAWLLWPSDAPVAVTAGSVPGPGTGIIAEFSCSW